MSLPSTAAYLPPNQNRYDDFVPSIPAQQSLPTPEPGTRPARPVPYELHAHADTDVGAGTVQLHLANTGNAAAVHFTEAYSRRSSADLLGPGQRRSLTWVVRGSHGW